MPLINCKVEVSLKWIEKCVLSTAATGANANATGADGATFKITDSYFMSRRQCKISKTMKRRI